MGNCITSVKRPPIGRKRESPNHRAALAACLFQNAKKMSRAHSLLC